MTTAAICAAALLAAVLCFWARSTVRRARREAADAQARLEEFISYHDRRPTREKRTPTP